jgi:hypothetical protein
MLTPPFVSKTLIAFNKSRGNLLSKKKQNIASEFKEILEWLNLMQKYWQHPTVSFKSNKKFSPLQLA